MTAIVLQDCCDDDERHATMRAGSIFEDAELFWRLRGDREDSARPRGCCGDHQEACYFYERQRMKQLQKDFRYDEERLEDSTLCRGAGAWNVL